MTSSIEVKRPPYPNFESFTVASKSWLTLWNICVTHEHGYVPSVVIPIQSVLHSWFIAGFVTRLKDYWSRNCLPFRYK